MRIPEQFENKRILLIDDQRSILSLTKSILNEAGFSTIIDVKSGEEALRGAARVSIDMAICDWNMPGMSGLEILRAFRLKDETKNMPFIMMTGEVSVVRVKEAAQAGVSDYIAKPIQPKMLVEKVIKQFKALES